MRPLTSHLAGHSFPAEPPPAGLHFLLNVGGWAGGRVSRRAGGWVGLGGWVGGGRHYPHPPGLPIRRKCGKVHRDLSDAIGPKAATYASHVGCSAWVLKKNSPTAAPRPPPLPTSRTDWRCWASHCTHELGPGAVGMGSEMLSISLFALFEPVSLPWTHDTRAGWALGGRGGRRLDARSNQFLILKIDASVIF